MKNFLKRRGFVGTLGRCIMESLYLVHDYPPSRLCRIWMAKSFDRKFGVQAALDVELKHLEISSPNWEYGVSYDPVPVDTFSEAIGHPQIKPKDFTFVDLGSGKGKALLLASEFQFKKNHRD